MKSIRADIGRYAIPFTGPVAVRGRRVDRRDGLVLSISTREGRGIGEIAPLPGLHDETIDDAEQALRSFIPELSSMGGNTAESRKRLLAGANLPPSVATGLEMALCNLEADAGGSPIVAFPGCLAPAARVPVNALLLAGTDPEYALQSAMQRFNEGFRVFKLKVRPDHLDEATSSIRAFHRTFGDRAELRLDANQSLDLPEAREFAGSLPEGSIAYIEEPLRDAGLLPEFHQETGMHVALDETLWQQPELLRNLPQAAISALVIKPNRIGGIAKSLELAAEARRNGWAGVFSSAFETGVSLGMYALLAAISSPTPAACGLDTASYLQGDIIATPFEVSGGGVDPLRAWRNGLDIRNDLLTITASWTS